MKALCEKEKGQILARLKNIKNFVHFGNVKYLGKRLSELRWKNGRRIYFYREDNNIIILLIGGLKNEQKKDIKKAYLFLKRYADYKDKKENEKKIIYEGFGFPIILLNVPMVELREIWTPNIDLNVLQKVILLALAHHPVDLTGNQIRFIRTWLGLTQSAFGKLFGVTHSAIVKWEKTNNAASKMNLSTQRDLRLYLLDQLLSRDDDFRKAFKTIHETEYTNKNDLLEVDVPIDLVAKKSELARATVQGALSTKGNPTIRTIAKIAHYART